MASISRSDIARLVLRVGVGGVMVAHGTQKLLGWFGGGPRRVSSVSGPSQGGAPATCRNAASAWVAMKCV
jgi:putative oxidoreductase